jgi:hypothetical protein
MKTHNFRIKAEIWSISDTYAECRGWLMMNLGRNDHEEYQKKGNESRWMERMTNMSQIWDMNLLTPNIQYKYTNEIRLLIYSTIKPWYLKLRKDASLNISKSKFGLFIKNIGI